MKYLTFLAIVQNLALVQSYASDGAFNSSIVDSTGCSYSATCSVSGIEGVCVSISAGQISFFLSLLLFFLSLCLSQTAAPELSHLTNVQVVAISNAAPTLSATLHPALVYASRPQHAPERRFRATALGHRTCSAA